MFLVLIFIFLGGIDIEITCFLKNLSYFGLRHVHFHHTTQLQIKFLKRLINPYLWISLKRPQKSRRLHFSSLLLSIHTSTHLTRRRFPASPKPSFLRTYCK